eukprot:6198347-Pleurochrysis_carterae.AAC.1
MQGERPQAVHVCQVWELGERGDAGIIERKLRDVPSLCLVSFCRQGGAHWEPIEMHLVHVDSSQLPAARTAKINGHEAVL